MTKAEEHPWSEQFPLFCNSIFLCCKHWLATSVEATWDSTPDCRTYWNQQLGMVWIRHGVIFILVPFRFFSTWNSKAWKLKRIAFGERFARTVLFTCYVLECTCNIPHTTLIKCHKHLPNIYQWDEIRIHACHNSDLSKTEVSTQHWMLFSRQESGSYRLICLIRCQNYNWKLTK